MKKELPICKKCGKPFDPKAKDLKGVTMKDYCWECDAKGFNKLLEALKDTKRELY